MRTVPAEPGHVDALIYRMPAEQRERLLAMHGRSVAQEIRGNVKKSTVTWCGLDDDGPVNIGGVLPNGYVWQFITPDVQKHKRDYIRQGRDLLAQALRLHDRIVTVIETSYPAAIRHAKRIGFEINPEQLVNGIPACVCERRR